MTSITRRQLLGAGAALAVGGYGGHRLLSGAPDASFDAWAPAQDTWPLLRYDAANTAHNPHATPPRQAPTRRALTSVGSHVRPLVGSSRIVLYGSTLASYSRERSTVTTVTDATVRHAGLGPGGTLHAVQQTAESESRYAVVSYDGATEMNRYLLRDHRPRSLTVGPTEVYVGTPSRNVLAIQSGAKDWHADGMMPTLEGGRLYTAGSSDGVVAYAEQSGLTRPLSAGPKQLWTAEWVPGQVHQPAVANGRLLVGTYDIPPNGGVVGAYDTENGERLWESRNLGMDVATPAVVGDRGYTAVGTEGLQSGRVVALDLTTGETIWADETDWYAYAPVVSEETLVVLGQVRDNDEFSAGKVRAYDTTSGEVLWTVTFESAVPNRAGVSLVGERVYATMGTTLYELA